MKTGPFGGGLFVLAGLVYVIASFQQGFDVQDAPDSPPSVVLLRGHCAIADSPIDCPASMRREDYMKLK
jgi:hypothetical protein